MTQRYSPLIFSASSITPQISQPSHALFLFSSLSCLSLEPFIRFWKRMKSHFLSQITWREDDGHVTKKYSFFTFFLILYSSVPLFLFILHYSLLFSHFSSFFALLSSGYSSSRDTGGGYWPEHDYCIIGAFVTSKVFRFYVPILLFLKIFQIWRYTHHYLFHFRFGRDFACKWYTFCSLIHFQFVSHVRFLRFMFPYFCFWFFFLDLEIHSWFFVSFLFWTWLWL